MESIFAVYMHEKLVSGRGNGAHSLELQETVNFAVIVTFCVSAARP